MSQPLLDDAARQQIERLQLVARSIVESFISGRHRSMYKGFSVEFAQHRLYARGDELRHIDWKVFGKSDRLFVKQYDEETNLRATLCLDASASMSYAGGGEQKLEYAKKLAAALALLMSSQGDAVSLFTFDTVPRTHLPARSTTAHLETIFRTLVETQPGGETALGPVLQDLAAQQKRRGLLVLLSDCFAPAEVLLRALGQFHHGRHDVIVLQLVDPHEAEFPFDGVAEFRDLERAGNVLRADAPRLREDYRRRFAEHQQKLREACHRFRFDHALLRTDQPCEQALSLYLTRRFKG